MQQYNKGNLNNEEVQYLLELMIGVKNLNEVLIQRIISCIICFFALIILIGKYTISSKEEKQYDMEKIFYDKEIVENMGNLFSEEAEKEVFSLFEGECCGLHCFNVNKACWNVFLLVRNKLFIATGEYIEPPCICEI